MKWFLAAVGMMVAVAAAQEQALRYEVGTLAPNQQNVPVDVDLSGSVALVLQPTDGGRSAVVYRRDGAGAWALEDVLTSGTITAAALSASTEVAAVGVGNVVEIHQPAFPPNWVYFGTTSSIVLPNDEVARRIVIDGNYAAVVTEAVGLVIESQVVRIFEFSGGSWTQVKNFTYPPPPGLFGSNWVGGLSLRGTRLAVANTTGDTVEIRERGAAAGAWEVVATIDLGSLGLSEPMSLAVDGDRLAVVAESAAGGIPQVEAFSRNAGGTNAWGRTGTVQPGEVGTGLLTLDADGGNLAVISIPSPQLFYFDESGSADIYGPGGGATGWAHEAHRELGPINGFPSSLSLGSQLNYAAISGNDVWFGLADEGYPGGSAAWAATVFRRGSGGPAGWMQVQVIDGWGEAEGLGRSIAMGGGLIAVGMPDDAWFGPDTGSVMVWALFVTGEDEGQVLLPLGRVMSPTPQAGARFGESVAVYSGSGSPFGGGILVVGAPDRDGGKGAAYRFDIQSGRIQPGVALVPGETLAVGDAFGESVSVTGNPLSLTSQLATTIAVGAPGDDDAAADAGAVFVFGRNVGGTGNWGRRTKRARPAGVSGENFGAKVSFFGPIDTLMAVTRPPTAGTNGEVAVLAKDAGGSNAWGQQVVLDAPAGSPPGFASSIGGSSFFLGVGATANIGGTGKAYVYPYNSPTWEPVIEAVGTAAEGPSFGSAVSVSDMQLCVGSPKAASGAGKISVWGRAGGDFTDWNLLFHQTGQAGASLGAAVGNYHIYSAAGAPGADVSGPDDGAVVVNRAGSYEIWAKARGSAIQPGWLPQDDADGDGQANLIEFSLGSNPALASSRGVFRLDPGVYSSGLSSGEAMIWDLPVTGYPQDFLDLRVERSDALTIWGTADWESTAGRRYYLREGRPRQFYRLAPLYPWFGPASGDGGIIFVP